MAELNSSPEKNNGQRLRKAKNLRVDLTAMVDLAFLLVTFFMLTTSLSKPKAMDLAMPSQEGSGEVSDKRTLTICLGKDNKVLVYKGLADQTAPQLLNFGRSGLRQALVDNQKIVRNETGKEMIVLVKPSEHSVYGNLVDALDELNITRVPTYAVVDIDAKDIGLLKKQSAY